MLIGLTVVYKFLCFPHYFVSSVRARIHVCFFINVSWTLSLVAGPMAQPQQILVYKWMNEWIHKVFFIAINIIIIIKDLYRTDLTNFLFYKNIHFIFLNVKIKMSQLVIGFETITIECLAEHQRQCLGNCREPKIYRIVQSWAATTWVMFTPCMTERSHSSSYLTVP